MTDLKKLRLKINYLDISKLKEYPLNAKIHTYQQIEEIKASIKEFGMNDPIAIDEKTKVIIEGHGRLIACEELEYKKIPVIKLGHMNKNQQKMYRLAHNKINMNTGFDVEILESEINEIMADMEISEEFFSDITGFTAEDLEEILEKDNEEINTNKVENPEENNIPGDPQYCILQIAFENKHKIEKFLDFIKYEGNKQVQDDTKFILASNVKHPKWKEK